ncbi:hypothetical protein HUU62_26705 [Rhodoferax sp. 4810]|uniref:Uncharacterized protein n=1 Tax=Thiospirillum jenense TaxID=1653858 RepID=A0A839H7L7_9GAMM|nr:hypothetical protein [Rhodoferax jenense]MBB1125575.1 hypothetical protein [Thiospirillum jenense]
MHTINRIKPWFDAEANFLEVRFSDAAIKTLVNTDKIYSRTCSIKVKRYELD